MFRWKIFFFWDTFWIVLVSWWPDTWEIAPKLRSAGKISLCDFSCLPIQGANYSPDYWMWELTAGGVCECVDIDDSSPCKIRIQMSPCLVNIRRIWSAERQQQQTTCHWVSLLSDMKQIVWLLCMQNAASFCWVRAGSAGWFQYYVFPLSVSCHLPIC